MIFLGNVLNVPLTGRIPICSFAKNHALGRAEPRNYDTYRFFWPYHVSCILTRYTIRLIVYDPPVNIRRRATIYSEQMWQASNLPTAENGKLPELSQPHLGRLLTVAGAGPRVDGGPQLCLRSFAPRGDRTS
jgi:hypothetical protein